ncbi:aspartic-type endopeptidase [Myriangium duriaei CBS 260.36]|uniref:Probable aspartic-type endopeptidase OPSB n=1 Tax=Myriangium duriaei CBS 260.36 TaxID=1168546 RepID=A0A9P4MQS1_9PEZI|nr:aspartic-type endopeptidase [Myriangium duriaei CBS 260.36]
MRNFPALCCAASLATSALAFTIVPRSDSSTPKVVQHDIERRKVSNPLVRDKLRRRASSKTISESLTNEQTLYFANCSLGTPAQSLRLHIDTGSSDLWTNSPNSEICQYKNEGLCSASGTYVANKSSSYNYVNSYFKISYADNSGASGDYATDVFTIGGSTLQDQQFGIGYKSTSPEGIVGIGYPTNEAINGVRAGLQYANVPQKMMQSGLINSNAYSLWLNDLDASTGSILFGGIDTGKYHGSLETLPIIQTDGVYSAFYIALTGVGIKGTANSLASDLKTPVLLDSGSSLTYLPDNITTQVYSALGVTYDQNEGAAFIDCSRANDDWSIGYTFSSPTISVSISELVVEIGTQGGKPICILGIAPSGDTTSVLGDTFLRSAYVVYDISSNQIGLAQTNFNSTTSNIQEITNGTSTSSGIPDSTGVANAVSEVPTTVAGGARNGLGTVSSTAAAAATPPPRKILQGVGAAGLLAAGAMFAI